MVHEKPKVISLIAREGYRIVKKPGVTLIPDLGITVWDGHRITVEQVKARFIDAIGSSRMPLPSEDECASIAVGISELISHTPSVPKPDKLAKAFRDIIPLIEDKLAHLKYYVGDRSMANAEARYHDLLKRQLDGARDYLDYNMPAYKPKTWHDIALAIEPMARRAWLNSGFTGKIGRADESPLTKFVCGCLKDIDACLERVNRNLDRDNAETERKKDALRREGKLLNPGHKFDMPLPRSKQVGEEAVSAVLKGRRGKSGHL
jgi:hypothetical protein